MRKLTELLLELDIKCILGDVNRNIAQVRYNSREVSEGDLFIAIKGEKSDGHDYINQAVQNGASAIISEKLITSFVGTNIPIIIVENTRKALARIAYSFHGNPSEKIKVIGVTGTNGKTTITHILKAIYDKVGLKTGLIGTNGIIIGDKKLNATHTTPNPLEIARLFEEMIIEQCSVVIMEVSSHALFQYRVEGIEFDFALFSNLSQDHLDYHKDMNNYAKSKKMLFDGLGEDKFAIINGDSGYAEMMINNTHAEIVKVGRNTKNHAVIVNEKLRQNGINYDLLLDTENYSFSSNLIGSFNVENLALASALALKDGISAEVINNAISDGIKVKGRMEKYELPNGGLAIIDYAHTPDALRNAIETSKELLINDKNRLSVVFGCGGDRDKVKRSIMGKIASQNADIAFITNDNPRTENPNNIIKDILTGIEESDLRKVRVETDRMKAIIEALHNAKSGDIVLIAGKGHENYQVIGKEKLHFDDSEIVKSFSSHNKY